MKLSRYSRTTMELSPLVGSMSDASDGDRADTVRPDRGRLTSTRNNFHLCASAGSVLLVVPDFEIRGLLRYGLEQQGFDLLEAGTGSEGIEIATRRRPRSVLLDMDVARPDGVAVIRSLREATRIPILALAGRENRLKAADVLDHGANDFINRPFDIEELSARLRAAQRNAPPPLPEVFRSGSLIVDLTRRVVEVAGRAVKLTATEYSLLHLFIRNPGMVLTHAQILREIWGAEMLDKISYLRVYMLTLRKKLANPPEPELFLTEPSIGYRLVVRDA